VGRPRQCRRLAGTGGGGGGGGSWLGIAIGPWALDKCILRNGQRPITAMQLLKR